MKRFQGHTGRCYILGNGPSLKDVNLNALKYDGHIFGTNRIYLSGFTPDYYVCVNPLVLEQFGNEIAEMDCTKFISGSSGVKIENKAGEMILLDTSYRIPSFRSPEEPMWEGYTVTYVALQLAYYMGFDDVVLLGVDHDYGKPYQPNIDVVSTEEDQAHFHPDYFGPGTRWNAPDLASSEIAYSLAAAHFKQAGRKVINASVRTKLRAFPVQPLNNLNRETRVSAIVSAYKAEDFIIPCLTDLMLQTEKPEIVVVCKSGSYEHEVAKQIPGVNTIISTADTPTIYAAWNMGIEAAHGRYLTNANADDRHHPDAYKIMADVLDARPEIDVVYHDQYITWKPNETYSDFVESNRGLELVSGRWQGKPGYFGWADYERKTLRQGCYIGPQPMWRANLHQLYGPFEAQYRSAGDYEFWLRVAREDNFLHIPYPLGLYLARPDGIELGDPITSQEETTAAIYLHQETNADFQHLGSGYFRLNLGDRYIAIQTETIKAWAAWAEEHANATIRIPMPE